MSSKSDIRRIITREWEKKQKKKFLLDLPDKHRKQGSRCKNIFTCVREVFGSGVFEEAAVARSKCGYLIDF